MKYLDSTHESNPTTDKLELETFLDAIQPGWRNVVVRQRFLPVMIVYNAIVTAEQGDMSRTARYKSSRNRKPLHSRGLDRIRRPTG